jgi:O-antigen ligase
VIIRRRDPALYFIAPFFVIFLVTSLTEANAMTQNDWNWLLLTAMAARLTGACDEPSLGELWRRKLGRR